MGIAMTIEATERRDFLKTLVKAGLAGAATVVLATQAQAERAPKRNTTRASDPKQRKQN